MAINKDIKERVWNKYDCKCAYCGNELEYKKMQVDHVVPIYRNDTDEDLVRMSVVRGLDQESNYVPSCGRCNRWKATFTVEKFRSEIEAQLDRLRKSSASYRMSLDYGLLKEEPKKVVFHFETFGKINWLVPTKKGYNQVVPQGELTKEMFNFKLGGK